nr:dynein regulatory complex protein 9 [Oryctolagus cuniculus]XP_008264958.1 dynein regulatory complex protein 9 [Oryctolagus cuniculus]XP_051715174.1 dynein regulatory complex protein 9 [Oryctolagus cuniculus]XP_051715175.1 dynein regulatory complex protein 9 [Oryctolagus cuniculus]XP_051715176.1 dynein regulatory complex protein 9 [Oryctolagus cuniculus]
MEDNKTNSRRMERDRLEASNLPPKLSHSEVMMSVIGEPPTAKDKEEETRKEIGAEIVDQLSLLDVLRILAVLEDTTDQLSIINYIMPVQFERRQSTIVKDTSSLEKAMITTAMKMSNPSPPKGPKLPEIRQGGQFAGEYNKTQDFIFRKPTWQTIMTMETLKKIQNDRRFFSNIITSTMQDLQDSGTFPSLLQALSRERENKKHFYDVIAREEKGKKQIKSLQRQLVNVREERQAEAQNQNEYIAHLKDQLQEMKAKTNLENCYMKKITELQIAQTQKKGNKAEELLLEEIEKLRMKMEEENRTHREIEMFLKKEQQKLEEKLEFWMEKFDKDTEMKQNELNALKAAKASDLAHLQDLAKLIREYEQVIIEDRIEKEKTRKKIEQDDLELRSIIKLQAWWRGTVIRKEIGGFKLPKKEKDDSKESKGKGKDKDKRRGKK